MTTVYYYGCIGEAGHYLFARQKNGAIRSVYDVKHPWEEKGKPHIDGGLAPGKRHRYEADEEAPMGQAALHYKRGWTALSFWDRTVDGRGNSSSTFLAEGFFAYADFVQLAKEQWPELWARFARGGDPPVVRPGVKPRVRELTPFEVTHVETVADQWGLLMARAIGASTESRLTAANARDYSPDDLRELGWSVAVHNDYRNHGNPYTFWLMTKDGRALKGEGATDAEALNEIRKQIAQPEKDPDVCT